MPSTSFGALIAMTKLVSEVVEATGGWRGASSGSNSPRPAALNHLSTRSKKPNSPSAGVHSVSVRSEEHTSELQSLMRISYAVFCLKKKKHRQRYPTSSLAGQLMKERD